MCYIKIYLKTVKTHTHAYTHHSNSQERSQKKLRYWNGVSIDFERISCIFRFYNRNILGGLNPETSLNTLMVKSMLSELYMSSRFSVCRLLLTCYSSVSYRF